MAGEAKSNVAFEDGKPHNEQCTKIIELQKAVEQAFPNCVSSKHCTYVSMYVQLLISTITNQ